MGNTESARLSVLDILCAVVTVGWFWIGGSYLGHVFGMLNSPGFFAFWRWEDALSIAALVGVALAGQLGVLLWLRRRGRRSDLTKLALFISVYCFLLGSCWSAFYELSQVRPLNAYLGPYGLAGPSWAYRYAGPWSTAKLSQPRAFMAAASAGDTAIFAGGRGPGYVSAVVDIFNAATGHWRTAHLSLARSDFSGAALDGRFFFAGGVGERGSGRRVDVYDLRTGRWSKAQLSRSRSALAAVAVGQDVVFAGGDGWRYSSAVDIFDVKTGQWQTAKLSQPRPSLAATAVGHLALFAGGADAAGYSDRVDIFDEATGKWSTARLSQAREALAATTVGDLAMFAGGLTPNGPSAAVDIFDAATGKWSTAKLSQPRGMLAATTVGHYAIFAGGMGGANWDVSDVVDIYDARTGAWSTAKLSQARCDLAATTADGAAIFAGGYASGGAASDVVDIFRPPVGGLATAAGGLSAPAGALAAYSLAIRRGDVRAALACISTSGKREEMVVKSLVVDEVANERLAKVSLARLGKPPQKLDPVLSGTLTTDRVVRGAVGLLRTAKVEICGDRASVTVRGAVGAEAGRTETMHLVKSGGDWKIEGRRMPFVPFTEGLRGRAFKRQVRESYRMAGVLNAAAHDVEAGKVKSWAALGRDVFAKLVKSQESAGRGGPVSIPKVTGVPPRLGK